jgi:hypothetical protein
MLNKMATQVAVFLLRSSLAHPTKKELAFSTEGLNTLVKSDHPSRHLTLHHIANESHREASPGGAVPDLWR